jgi:hypothetical protein
MCMFLSNFGECLKGMKTLMAIFFKKCRNIVLDSCFGKRIATMVTNCLLQKGYIPCLNIDFLVFVLCNI